MNTLFILSDPAAKALGWALLHSVWQIGVWGIVLSVFLPRTHRPELRYQLALGAQMMAALGFIGTFLWYWSPEQPADPVFWSGKAHLTIVNTDPSALTGIDSYDLLTTIGNWVEEWHTQIVAVWLVGFVLLLLRMAGSLWFLRRLRHTSTMLTSAHQWMEQLASDKGMHRVRLLLSDWITTPITYGFFRPVVVFPISLLNRLSPEEAEALLLHELAHITRRDWLFQMLQSIVEAVFYFHPVIWWISAVIRMNGSGVAMNWPFPNCGKTGFFMPNPW